MSEFVYLFRGPGPSGFSPQQMQAHLQRWREWIKDLTTRGYIKDPGQPLERAGKLVKGRKAVTDGPYAEKDVVAGYMLIDARDIEEAAELSENCPMIDTGGTVEVRPVARLNL
jgi:hypothetical protein